MIYFKPNNLHHSVFFFIFYIVNQQIKNVKQKTILFVETYEDNHRSLINLYDWQNTIYTTAKKKKPISDSEIVTQFRLFNFIQSLHMVNTQFTKLVRN